MHGHTRTHTHTRTQTDIHACKHKCNSHNNTNTYTHTHKQFCFYSITESHKRQTCITFAPIYSNKQYWIRFYFHQISEYFQSAIGRPTSLMIHHSQWKEWGMSFNYSCGMVVVVEVVSSVVLCLITCLLASGLMFNYAIYCRLPLPSPGHREAFSYYTNHPNTSTSVAAHKQYTQTKSAASWIKTSLERRLPPECRSAGD